MTLLSIFCYIIVLVGAIWVGCNYFSDDTTEDESNDCGPGSKGKGGSGGSDLNSCTPSRASWSSCCSAYPSILEQVTLLSAGSLGKCNNYGPGNCVCIPNIGSMFVGAAVASVRDTVPYKHPLGLPSSEITNKPELTIEPSEVIIGKNWHFTGIGTLVVKLFQPSLISGFTVIHPQKCQIPKGFETSALKDFYVMGMNDLDEKVPFFFGNFSYNIMGRRDQSFPVEFCSLEKYQLIEFRFMSNHGNPNYTALYKIQIHGDMGQVNIGLDTPTAGSGTEDEDDDDDN